MTDTLTHRSLAASSFNRTWDLLERERTEQDDLELLELAFTSRHHWRAEGGAQQITTADWMVSRCFAELGAGELAVRFARAAVASQPEGAPAWQRASVFEGLARAHAANGDAAARDDAVAKSRSALDEETDDEERNLIAEQLASVPPAR